MLQKQFRLPASRHGARTAFFSTPYFTIRRWPNTLLHNRFGFIVSKKVDKRAVVRNRVRRLIRSCIEQDGNSFSGNSDILVFVKKEAVGISRETLTKEMHNALQKVIR